MASWRVARSLNKLLEQIDEMAPRRSKASDGSIGDRAHRRRRSDHNPDRHGVVRARDFTHDPGRGADMHHVAEALRISRDRRISYVIWNRRVFSAVNEPWRWRPYSGSNPHDKHMHVSVVSTAAADNTDEWGIVMPLTNEDIKRISDATAAKVLGKSWSIPGRTLAGSVEALITFTRGSAQAHAVTVLMDKVEEVLAEVSDDPKIDGAVSPADRSVVAKRLVERLIPTGPEDGTVENDSPG